MQCQSCGLELGNQEEPLCSCESKAESEDGDAPLIVPEVGFLVSPPPPYRAGLKRDRGYDADLRGYRPVPETPSLCVQPKPHDYDEETERRLIAEAAEKKEKALAAMAESGISDPVTVLHPPVGVLDPLPEYRPGRPTLSYMLMRSKQKPRKSGKTKGFPSGSPKGFPSEVPISSLQPRFRSLSGDYSMAGPVTNRKTSATDSQFHSGPPNMNLVTVRQAALKQAEQKWKEIFHPLPLVQPEEFIQSGEWLQTTRIKFPLTGFNFTEAPPTRTGGKAIADGPVVNVESALAETEEDVEESFEQSQPLNRIDWDEIEHTASPEVPVFLLGKALELFEPAPKVKEVKQPAPQKSAKAEKEIPVAEVPKAAEIIVEAKVEEPPFMAPPMAELKGMAMPALHKPPALPPLPAQEPMAASGSRMHFPTVSLAPLRNRIVIGPIPEELVEKKPAPPPPAPVEEIKKEEPKAVVEPPAAKPVEVVAEAPAPKPEAAPVAAPVSTPVVEPVVEAKQEAKPAEAKAAEAKPAEAKPTNGSTNGHGRKKKKGQKNNNRVEISDDPIEEPDELGEEVEAELAAVPKSIQAEAAQTDAVPERKPEPEKKKAAPKQDNQATVSFGGLANAEVKPSKTPQIGLHLGDAGENLPAPVGMGIGAKAGIAVAILAVAGSLVYFVVGGSTKPVTKPAISKPAQAVFETAGSVLGEAGWQTDYTNDPSGKRVRQLAIYRPSMQVNDYRVEFQAEIEYKAVSWAVRAANPKGNVILKLAQSGSTVRLVRFSVVDNKQGEAVEKALPFSTNLGMVFRVRTDVVGEKFRVTVNDQIVDEWTDKQASTGGFGVANEGAERGQVRSIQLWHLRERGAQ